MVYFERVELRTTDPERARVFYRALLGEADVPIVELPERARAMGAPSHWLGRLGVRDVEAEVARFVEAGATRLGPTRPDGVAVLKDPWGTPVALAKTDGSLADGLAWCELHCSDAAAAWRFYGEHFGWEHQGQSDTPIPSIRFSYPDGPPGSIVETVGATGAHPHWLFYLSVPDLDAAIAMVTEAGATCVYGPAARVGGRVAAIDGPTGAAFGFMQLES